MDSHTVIRTLREAEYSSHTSLDETNGRLNDHGTPANRYEHIADSRHAAPEDAAVLSHLTHTMTNIISQFPYREQVLLALTYFEGLTLSDAGQVLGISEAKASAIHAKALLSLKDGCAKLATSTI
jgi:RNA polymerase sigma factor for flagellar operon FliA